MESKTVLSFGTTKKLQKEIVKEMIVEGPKCKELTTNIYDVYKEKEP